MTIIIFIIILGLLVLVHELGHFLVAKKAGVRVEEFGFGYPPRALSLGSRWGTIFSLNWIPFGGFVKIFGENYEDEEGSSEQNLSERLAGLTEASTRNFSAEKYPCSPKDFVEKNFKFTEVSKKWQAAILVAGVFFNLLFAWFLFSLGFVIGLPTPVDNNYGGVVRNPVLTIVDILPNSPAQAAGLKSGDQIVELTNLRGGSLTPLTAENISNFFNQFEGDFQMKVKRGEKILDFDLTPEVGLVAHKKIIGINMDMVGTLRLPIHRAVIEGLQTTVRLLVLTVSGIFGLIKDAIFGQAQISGVTGPIGIISLVGDASRLGFAYLITFTALISINLAVINLVPFPALDGGRLLFVGIEALTRRPINHKFAQIANSVGFALLIALMLFVTYRDILKLF